MSKAIEHIVNNYIYRDNLEKVAGDFTDILDRVKSTQEKIAEELSKPDLEKISSALSREENLILKIANEYEF